MKETFTKLNTVNSIRLMRSIYKKYYKGVRIEINFLNVNGLRRCNKGFHGIFNELDADIFCLQEQIATRSNFFELPGYEQYWNSAVKKNKRL